MATVSAKQPRVHDEPAFVLHSHDWSESSLILEVFSRHHGRVALVAKGVKKPASQFRPVLLPLQPLRLTWGGDAEVRTLKNAHWQGGHLMPQGDALLSGYYLNELLLKLLARDDAHPVLFDAYAQAALALATGAAPTATVLRAFELVLLREVGFLPALDEEGASLQALRPEARYHLQAECGLVLQGDGQALGCPGAQWLLLQQALNSSQPFQALMAVCADEGSYLRTALRGLLHYHSGVRVFRTRQWMLEVQQLGGG